MYGLFEGKLGVVKTMAQREQALHLARSRQQKPEGVDTTTLTDDKEYLAKSHVADVSLSPANLTDLTAGAYVEWQIFKC